MPTTDNYEIPEITLIQNTGGSYHKQMGAKPGDFVRTIDDTVIPAATGFDMVVVRTTKQRTHWGRAEITNDPPTCSSENADSYRSRDGQDCRKCPYFTDSPGAIEREKRRQMCGVSWGVIAIEPETEMPFILRATGISVSEIKKLNTYLALNPKIRTVKHRVVFHVISHIAKTPAGEAFALSIIPKKELLTDGELAANIKLTTAELLGLALPVGREESEEPAEIGGDEEESPDVPVGEPLKSPLPKTEPDKIDLNF